MQHVEIKFELLRQGDDGNYEVVDVFDSHFIAFQEMLKLQSSNFSHFYKVQPRKNVK